MPTQWCVDCTDWQIRTENGETLPPPGGILSMEELGPRVPRPAALRDDMINMHGSASNFDDDDEVPNSDPETCCLVGESGN